MARLVGVDVGTSATKAVLVGEDGSVLAQSSRGYPLSVPKPGWAEQDPEHWVEAAEACLADLGGAHDAVAFTGQMHGSVFVGRDGRAVRPALLWCDQRTAPQCGSLERAAGPGRFASSTLNALSPGLQAPKVAWLREHEPGSFASTDRVMLPKDYVQFRLSGVAATEATDASGVGLFDVAGRAWDVALAESVGIDPGLFPPCSEPGQRAGSLRGAILVLGAGDQSAGAVGVGVAEEGSACVSLGTSGVALTVLRRPPGVAHGSLNLFCHVDGTWLRMGVMLSCGASVRWARDHWFPALGFDEMAQAAAESAPDDDGPLFLPYLMGERCPAVAPRASAALLGLRLGHGHRELARAVFEGVTHGLADCAELAFADAGVRSVRLTGGGSASPFWCQLVADFLGLPCSVPQTDEGPAFGAALLAGVGLGLWGSAAEAGAATVRVRREHQPSGRDLGPARARFAELRSIGLGVGP